MLVLSRHPGQWIDCDSSAGERLSIRVIEIAKRRVVIQAGGATFPLRVMETVTLELGHQKINLTLVRAAHNGKARIGVTAPRDVAVHRREVRIRIEAAAAAG